MDEPLQVQSFIHTLMLNICIYCMVNLNCSYNISKMQKSVIVIFTLFVINLAIVSKVCGIHPVVIIPGNGGNQIEGRITEDWDGGDCKRIKGWHRLWLNVWRLLPSQVSCWNKEFMLKYDPVTRTSKNMPGIETRVPGFGNTTSLEYLDPSTTAWLLGNAGAYFSKLVKELLSLGYKRGETLRGAPYDFRYAPHSQSKYFSNLKKMIEQMYYQSGNSRVVIVSHSAGGLFSLYFLNQVDQKWKNKYIERLVTVGTPWMGSTLIYQAFVSGFTFNVPILLPREARKQQRSSETNMLLFPRPVANKMNHVFVSTPWKNYSQGNMHEMFDDIDFKDGKNKLQRFREADYALKSPGVDLHCWFSSGEPTPSSYVYSNMKDFPDVDPEHVIMTDGDGTVPLSSLQFCREWENTADIVDIKVYPNKTHQNLLYHKPMLLDLMKLVMT